MGRRFTLRRVLTGWAILCAVPWALVLGYVEWEDAKCHAEGALHCVGAYNLFIVVAAIGTPVFLVVFLLWSLAIWTVWKLIELACAGRR